MEIKKNIPNNTITRKLVDLATKTCSTATSSAPRQIVISTEPS